MRKPLGCERLHSRCTIAGLWAAVYSDTVQPVPGAREGAQRPKLPLSSFRGTHRHMKRTDLVKHLAKKIAGQMQQAAKPGRFAQDANALPDRREQRKMDQAAGLMPFAVKLHVDLARQLRELAEQEGGNLNALVDRLIRAGLAGSAAPVAAPVKAAATKVAKPVTKKATAVKPAPKEEDKKTPATKVVKKAVAQKAPAKKAAAKKVASKVAKKAVKTKA